MTDLSRPRPTPLATTDLPGVVTAYLAAHAAHDRGTAIGAYAPHAVVTDDGRTYRGREEILGWLERSASEYRYTTELVGADRVDEEHVRAVQHLEGDFPGGAVDLRYSFTLRAGLIAELVIEPC